MAAQLCDVTKFLDELLDVRAFPNDYSNNGLQFQASNEVEKIVFGVDACAALFTAAADEDADMIVVHHGISWGGGIKQMRGGTAERIKLLAQNDMSLYACHLPMDANPVMGHNAILADISGVKDRVPFGLYHGYKIGFFGELPKAVTAKSFAALFDKKLPSEGPVDVIGDPMQKIKHPAFISGGGAFPELFEEIEESGVDCLVTGEASHTVFHYAMEAACPIITLGHYRSETLGVIAAMNSVRHHFNVECEFIDIPTGM